MRPAHARAGRWSPQRDHRRAGIGEWTRPGSVTHFCGAFPLGGVLQGPQEGRPPGSLRTLSDRHSDGVNDVVAVPVDVPHGLKGLHIACAIGGPCHHRVLART